MKSFLDINLKSFFLLLALTIFWNVSHAHSGVIGTSATKIVILEPIENFKQDVINGNTTDVFAYRKFYLMSISASDRILLNELPRRRSFLV